MITASGLRALLSIGAIVALLIAACSAASGARLPSPLPDLGGSAWSVVQLSGEAVLPPGQPFIRLDGREISGGTGCNTFSGHAAFTEGRIEIGSLSVTEMACAGPVGDREATFVRALTAVDAYRFSEDQLILDGPGGEIVLDPLAEGG